jgi:hypothetical protein
MFIPVSAVTSAMKDQQLAWDSDWGHFLTTGLARVEGVRASRGSSAAIILVELSYRMSVLSSVEFVNCRVGCRVSCIEDVGDDRYHFQYISR